MGSRKPDQTRDALEILDARHTLSADDLDQRATFGEAIEIAELIHDLRTRAGLTQRELADKVGTTASVICRLEDADYDGHSMTMLRRIAKALGMRVEVRFVPSG